MGSGQLHVHLHLYIYIYIYIYILGAFYTGTVFSSFMMNYSESYIEDLIVDSTFILQNVMAIYSSKLMAPLGF